MNIVTFLKIYVLAFFVCQVDSFQMPLMPVSRPGLHQLHQRRPNYGHSDTEINNLKVDVVRLETLVRELCGAIIFSDDLIVLERQTAALGIIYQDGNFESRRNPVFTRHVINEILNKRGLVAVPFPHTWTRK